MIGFRGMAIAGAAAVLAGALGAAPVDIGSFALRIPIAPAPGGSVQRVVLPAKVLLALQRADLGDLRVVDRTGKAMPIALADAAPVRTAGRRIVLTAYPILGAPGALKVTGMQVRIGEDQRAHIVGLSGAVDDKPSEAVTLGNLLDTRAIAAPAASLSLDVDVPQSQPVAFQVDASANLADWTPLARKVIYRAAANEQPVTSATIPLDGADLHGHYLRISWTAASRLLAPVRLRRAALTTQDGTAAAGRLLIEATTPALADPYHVRFALPFGVVPAALRIIPSGGPAIIPIKAFGRENREQTWTSLGEAVIDTIKPSGAGRPAAAVELPEGRFHEIRIDADPRSSGFSGPPHVELQFMPRQVVALMSGTPPFTLAAGSATADNVYLPVANLVRDDRWDDIPLARAKAPEQAAAMLALPAPADGTPRRTMILWLALVAATAILGAIIWALFRAMRRDASAATKPPG